MLGTFHDYAVVVVIYKLEGSVRRVAHQTGAHIHCVWCPAGGPTPEPSEWSAVLTRPPSGPRRARRLRSLFTVLRQF